MDPDLHSSLSALSQRMGGQILIPLQGSLHVSPGAETAFLRRTKLPKQINQSVRNLSTLSAKKLERELFLEMKKEAADTFTGSLPMGASRAPCPSLSRVPTDHLPSGQPQGHGLATASCWLLGRAQAQSHLTRDSGLPSQLLYDTLPSKLSPSLFSGDLKI